MGEHFQNWISWKTQTHKMASFRTKYIKIALAVEAGQRAKEMGKEISLFLRVLLSP